MEVNRRKTKWRMDVSNYAASVHFQQLGIFYMWIFIIQGLKCAFIISFFQLVIRFHCIFGVQCHRFFFTPPPPSFPSTWFNCNKQIDFWFMSIVWLSIFYFWIFWNDSINWLMSCLALFAQFALSRFDSVWNDSKEQPMTTQHRKSHVTGSSRRGRRAPFDIRRLLDSMSFIDR